jgi:hypothetical protein
MAANRAVVARIAEQRALPSPLKVIELINSRKRS